PYNTQEVTVLTRGGGPVLHVAGDERVDGLAKVGGHRWQVEERVANQHTRLLARVREVLDQRNSGGRLAGQPPRELPDGAGAGGAADGRLDLVAFDHLRVVPFRVRLQQRLHRRLLEHGAQVAELRRVTCCVVAAEVS